MLSFYVKRSTREDYQKVASAPTEDAWIHGDAVTDTDLQALVRTYKLDLNNLRDVLDRNELPRVEVKDKTLYVFVRMAQRAKSGTVTTTPVLLIVKGSIFINISIAPSVEHALAKPSVIAQSNDTTSLLLGTFATIVGEYEVLMQRTAEYVKDTGRRLRTHEVTNNDFIRFVTVEDNLNEYNTNLMSMLVVAERLGDTLEQSDDSEAVDDILLYIHQLLVAIESHRQSIRSIRDAYSTVANNTLNHRMKTLTVLTVLIAFPNVIYGMYGMNVSLPFQHEPWAYPALMVLSVLLILLVYSIAKRLRVL